METRLYDNDNDRFRAKTKLLARLMTAQSSHNSFVFGVIAVQFAVNLNPALRHFSLDDFYAWAA